MKSVLSGYLKVALALMMSLTMALVVSLSFSGSAQATTMATLPGLNGVFSSTRPDNLGVTEGHLAGCPASPNCVVSQGADEEHEISPIAYTTNRETARQNLIDILGVVPRTQVIEEQSDYVLAESESRLMGFVDDSEFYFPAGEPEIQVRAAARLGESDLGVNRRRIEQIRLAFQDLERREAAQ